MENKEFDMITTHYMVKSQNLSRALNEGITRRAEDILSLDEAHKRIEEFLSRSIGQWVEDFLMSSYPIRVKQKARQRLHALITADPTEMLFLEKGVEQAVEDSLKQLTNISQVIPPIEISSVYLKPFAVLLCTAVVVLIVQILASYYGLNNFTNQIISYYGLNNFTNQIISYLPLYIREIISRINIYILFISSIQSSNIWIGAQIARRVLREEQRRARELLKDQGKEIVDQFAKEAEAYLYAAAEATEAATDQYIQKQLQLNQSIQNQLSETMEEKYDQPAQPNSSANSNAGDRDDRVIHKKVIDLTA